jgi:hypothetical protein
VKITVTVDPEGFECLDLESRNYIADVDSAIHEASHLCCALARGVPASAALTNGGGHVRVDTTLHSLNDCLTIASAALVVTAKYSLKPTGTSADLDDIRRLTADLPEQQAAAAKFKALKEAETFLNGHEPELFRLAQALLDLRALPESVAWPIYIGTSPVALSADFLEAVRRLPRCSWVPD